MAVLAKLANVAVGTRDSGISKNCNFAICGRHWAVMGKVHDTGSYRMGNGNSLSGICQRLRRDTNVTGSGLRRYFQSPERLRRKSD